MQAATPAATSTSGKVQYYSNETYVPAVTSVATLGGYLTVDAFGDDDRQRVSFTLRRPTHELALVLAPIAHIAAVPALKCSLHLTPCILSL